MPRMYQAIFGQMKKQLAQVDRWFDAAVAFAQARKCDPSVFLGLRLAPDQFPLARQVQLVCDTARMAAARVSGKEAPAQADTETTLDDLRARVKATVAYLDGFSAKDFTGVESRTVTQPRWEGKHLSAPDYFVEHAVPNFYFHLAHVYAILRHSGVDLGKKDYLGALSFKTA